MKDRALVLGGGGVAGIAWMTGLMLGLCEQGVKLRLADLVLGTSAGATLGAQLGSRVSLQELYRRMTDSSGRTREMAPDLRLLNSFREKRMALAATVDPKERILKLGKWALEAETVPEAERRSVVAQRLPSHSWPDSELRIVVIDAESGALTIFDHSSGVDLVDAVAASCAVPGIWPPVTINGRRYIDGGVRSAENADLAKGYARIVILSPMGTTLPRIGGGSLKDQIESLEQAGAKTYLVNPDSKSRRAIGLNPFSPETRGPAAKAGRKQGQSIGKDIAAFWNVASV